MAADTSSGNIAWAATLKLALARGLAFGIVLALLVPPAVPEYQAWELLISGTLGHTVIMGFLHLAAKVFSPMRWALVVPMALTFVSDCIVYGLNRLFPAVLRVADFKPWSLRVFWVVYSPDEVAHSEQSA